MKKRVADRLPYGHNPNITCYYEYVHGKDTIRPGDKIKIKNLRGAFIFHKWAVNSDLDARWIDCIDSNTGEFRAFHLDKLKGLHRTPKKRIKKAVNA